MITYRFQFNDGQNVDNRNPNHTRFTLADAKALVPYLHEMGVTHIYASPLTQAEKGQNHGYGVTDYNKIDEDLGGIEGLRELSAELKKHDMGLILDIVPNHMYTSYANEWWRDVLAKGEKSDYADHFEIDWSKDKILLPDLGDQFGFVLDAGDLKLKEEENGDITLNYWAHKYPINPKHYAEIRQPAKGDVAGYWNKPAEGDWRGKDALRALIKKQNYRLEDWRVGHGEGSYRRFFDINTLVGVMQEKPHVRADSHRLVKQLVDEDLVQGYRVDHVDGVADPIGYCEALRELIGPDLPIFVEKIVEGKERLLTDLPVQGMTGYEFLNDVGRLHGDKHASHKIDAFYKTYTGEHREFPAIHDQAKYTTLQGPFSKERTTLIKELTRLAHTSDYSGGLTGLALGQALDSLIVNFRVYRSYNKPNQFAAQDLEELGHAIEASKNPGEGPPKDCRAISFVGDVLTGKLSNNEYDQTQINEIVRKFQQLTSPVMARSGEDTAFYRYNRNIALNEVGGDPAVTTITSEKFHAENIYRAENMPLTMNTMQTHDTKLGDDTRKRIMVALNQFPKEFIAGVRRWTEMNEPPAGETQPDGNDRLRFYEALVGTWPADMTDLSDPRLGPYEENTIGADQPGAYTKRVAAYMEKSIKEAKVHTTWTEKNSRYEDAVKSYVRRALNPENLNSDSFLRDFMSFQQKVAAAAAIDSLGDIALQAASVGTPDIYNGTELWDETMVDPDNRSAVDYERRKETLETLKAGSVTLPHLKAHWTNGEIKQAVTQQAMTARRDHPEIFEHGKYIPVHADNARDDNRLTSLMRDADGAGFLIVAPRHVNGHVSTSQLKCLDLSTAYNGVTVHTPGLPAGTRLTSRITGEVVEVKENETVEVGSLLKNAPIAVFSYDTSGQDRIKQTTAPIPLG